MSTNNLLTRFAIAIAASLLTQAQAKGPDAMRIEEAKINLQRFVRDGRELTDRQYVLFSLRIPMRPAEVDQYAEKYGMQVQTINFCTGQGGSAHHISVADTVARQASAVNLGALRRSALRGDDPSAPTDSDLSPDDLRLCGFEARLLRSDLERISSDIEEKVFSIEVSDGRRRMLPINRWRLYLE